MPVRTLVLASVLFVACRQPGTNASLSDINAEPLGLDFGAIAVGLTATKTVTLSNSGRTSLQIDAIEVSGTGATRFTVDPGGPLELVERRTLTVSWTPTREGLDVAQLTVRSDARNTGALQIALSGVGITAANDAGTTPMDGGSSSTDGGVRPPRDAGYFADDSGCPPTWATGTEAVTYQVDSAHTGEQPDDRLTLPLCERWRRDLGGSTGYAVASRDLVYVVSVGAQGRRLWALDQYTGATRWGPTGLGGSYSWVALALGNGALYALSDNGALVAFDAQSGQQRWIQMVGRSDSAPTAITDGLFVSVDQQVKSLNPANGSTRWSRPVANGDTSSPAVRGNLVATSYACNQAYAFSLTGTQLWHATSSCSGGGGKTTAVHDGKVYTRDSNGDLVLDGATGTLVGSYTSRLIPAFAGNLAIFSTSTATQGVVPTNNQATWSAEGVIAAPVVMGEHVVLPTATGLVVLNALTGVEVDRTALAGIQGTDEQNVSSPFAGLNAANGMLFVPVGNSLVAY